MNRFHHYLHAIGLCLLTLCTLTISNLNGQSLDWAGQLSDTTGVSLSDMVLDNDGNIIMCGTSGSATDLDPGPGVFAIDEQGSFIAKTGPTGSFIWGFKVSSLGIQAVTTDDDGNVLAAFQINETTDFDPGPGIFNITPDNEIFGNQVLVKYSSAGIFQWAVDISATGSSGFTALAVDPDGNICLSGFYNNTMDFDPGAGSAEETAVGSADVFVLKLDGNGAFIWVESFGGNGFDYAQDMAVDAFGNILVYGAFSGTADFDPGSGVFNLTAQGSDEFFVSKLNGSGDFQWASGFGGNGGDLPTKMHIDGNGFVYAGGQFAGSGDFDPGSGSQVLTAQGSSSDAFLIKLSDATGNLAWARQFSGEQSSIVFDLTTDNNGNVFSTGGFTGTTDFDPGPGNFFNEGTNIFDLDIFISRLDSDGNYSCAVAIQGLDTEIAYRIMSASTDRLLLGGIFEGTIDFDPGNGVTELTNQGESFPLSEIESDVFIIQLDVPACPSVGVAENTFDHPINFYPNPTAGSLYIDMKRTYEQVDFILTDLAGRAVASSSFEDQSIMTLELHQLNAGIYLLQVVADDSRSVIKVVVE